MQRTLGVAYTGLWTFLCLVGWRLTTCPWGWKLGKNVLSSARLLSSPVQEVRPLHERKVHRSEWKKTLQGETSIRAIGLWFMILFQIRELFSPWSVNFSYLILWWIHNLLSRCATKSASSFPSKRNQRKDGLCGAKKSDPDLSGMPFETCE